MNGVCSRKLSIAKVVIGQAVPVYARMLLNPLACTVREVLMRMAIEPLHREKAPAGVQRLDCWRRLAARSSEVLRASRRAELSHNLISGALPALMS